MGSCTVFKETWQCDSVVPVSVDIIQSFVGWTTISTLVHLFEPLIRYFQVIGRLFTTTRGEGDRPDGRKRGSSWAPWTLHQLDRGFKQLGLTRHGSQPSRWHPFWGHTCFIWPHCWCADMPVLTDTPQDRFWLKAWDLETIPANWRLMYDASMEAAIGCLSLNGIMMIKTSTDSNK